MSYSKPNDSHAVQQFNKSSMYSDFVPHGYTAWEIRNDYPPPKPKDLAPGGPPPGTLDAPWLDVDPKRNPVKYLEIAKEYCLDGMIAADFVPQKNTVRQWYHAPWMHHSHKGREPLRGLTAERSIQAHELSTTQERMTQTWAISFYNTIGASVFGGMWADPDNPNWKENKAFPIGTMVYKLLFTNATDAELPILKDAPTWEGLISVQPADPKELPKPEIRDLFNPQSVRLLQMDVAMRDHHAVGGWIWGNFMYSNTSGKTGWDGLIPVGLQWGNDTDLTQAKWKDGERVKESWISPEADALRVSLQGSRPSFGWNGRLNGPTDNFISACASCHSTAEWPRPVNQMPPMPTQVSPGKWEPQNDKETMTWFKDVPWGTPLSPGSVTADNSYALFLGYQNFLTWSGQLSPENRYPDNPRQGPIIKY